MSDDGWVHLELSKPNVVASRIAMMTVNNEPEGDMAIIRESQRFRDVERKIG